MRSDVGRTRRCWHYVPGPRSLFLAPRYRKPRALVRSTLPQPQAARSEWSHVPTPGGCPALPREVSANDTRRNPRDHGVVRDVETGDDRARGDNDVPAEARARQDDRAVSEPAPVADRNP